MRKSVGQTPTASEQTQQKPCRTSSDIGEELKNHTVGRGPIYDREGLNNDTFKVNFTGNQLAGFEEFCLLTEFRKRKK
jgi:hypothetical protein